jgi:hypothetical protein
MRFCYARYRSKDEYVCCDCCLIWRELQRKCWPEELRSLEYARLEIGDVRTESSAHSRVPGVLGSSLFNCGSRACERESDTRSPSFSNLFRRATLASDLAQSVAVVTATAKVRGRLMRYVSTGCKLVVLENTDGLPSDSKGLIVVCIDHWRSLALMTVACNVLRIKNSSLCRWSLAGFTRRDGR